MTTEQFLSNFRHVATAPSGVMRLRELILHLAVSGRLVPKISDEGDGEASITKAKVFKDKYRAEYELRPSGSDRPLVENELAFEIPMHWKWERLGNVACYIQRGKGPKYDDAGKTLVVSQKCVQRPGFDLSPARRISEDSVKDYSRERFLVSGDILWNSTGTGTAGRLVLFPGAKDQVVADSHVTIIRFTNFVAAYVKCYLTSPTIQQRMIPGQENSMVTGTTNQVELSATMVSDLPIPCPPIAEQKRIVAKVDELMAICDQLEAQQQDRGLRFPVLSQTCHALFTEAPSSANLNRIFDETGTVSPADLRKSIFSLAIQGSLAVESSVASMWPKVTLKEVCEQITDGEHATPQRTPAGIPLATAKNVRDGFLDLSQTDYVAQETADKCWKRCRPTDGDILMVCVGATTGRLCLIRNPPDMVLVRSVALLRPNTKRIEGTFLDIFLRSPSGQSQIWGGVRQNAQPCLYLGKMSEFIISLPSIAEQRRVVDKVNELMVFVNNLEAQQKERDSLAEAFAKDYIASFTGSTILERPEKMKAPKTELDSVVNLGKKPKRDAKAPLAQLLHQNKGRLPAKALWQRSGLTIDAFYQQLKTELAQGWIAPPKEAEMRILEEA